MSYHDCGVCLSHQVKYVTVGGGSYLAVASTAGLQVGSHPPTSLPATRQRTDSHASHVMPLVYMLCCQLYNLEGTKVLHFYPMTSLTEESPGT